MIKLFGFTILSEKDKHSLVSLPEHYTYDGDHWRGFERYRNDLREKLGYPRLHMPSLQVLEKIQFPHTPKTIPDALAEQTRVFNKVRSEHSRLKI